MCVMCSSSLFRFEMQCFCLSDTTPTHGSLSLLLFKYNLFRVTVPDNSFRDNTPYSTSLLCYILKWHLSLYNVITNICLHVSVVSSIAL